MPPPVPFRRKIRPQYLVEHAGPGDVPGALQPMPQQPIYPSMTAPPHSGLSSSTATRPGLRHLREGVHKHASGNIKLRVTDGGTDMATPHALLHVETIEQKRWPHLAIQSPVSPADTTTHGRFMVMANKASFNVSITGLDDTGRPWGAFTVPAGLGAHGVTFGKKSMCDADDDGVEDTAYPAAICYYAFVTNNFRDYVSVYDLEKIDINDDQVNNNPAEVGMQNSGSALLAESVYVEGGAVATVATLDPGVASLCSSVLTCGTGLTGGTYISNLPIGVLCPDCSSGVHMGTFR